MSGQKLRRDARMIKLTLNWPHLSQRALSDAAWRDRYDSDGPIVSDIRDPDRGHRLGAWPDGSTRGH